jgi:hypothetical protein
MANDTNFVPVRAHLRRTGSASEIQQEHAPDTQAMPEGDDGDDMLPMGDNTQGMSGNVANGMSDADLQRGFDTTLDAETINRQCMPREGDQDDGPTPMEQNGGFAGRPGGWER